MESNDTVLDNGVSPGMEELDREINEDDYDVNSIDINSRDASLASALDFHPGYGGSRTNTSSNGRRTVKTRKSVPPPASESSGPRSRAPPKKPYEVVYMHDYFIYLLGLNIYFKHSNTSIMFNMTDYYIAIHIIDYIIQETICYAII